MGILGTWGGGLNREITVLGVQSSWCICSQAFIFGVFFSTGIPTSSYFLAASNGGLGA